jgi:2-polyprenyl-3-methyl-5-hydroxy-6-metoxy-1,4-benzoquinol methylase
MTDNFADYQRIKGWNNQDFAIIRSKSLFNTYSSIIRENITGSVHLALDFGFGNGEMLKTLRELQVKDIYGVEVNAALVVQANDAGFKAYGKIADIAAENFGQFDLITVMHVLEHVKYEELIELFDFFGKLLKPGGCLITAFPNGESPFSSFAFNSDPTHLTLLTREKCRIIALDKPLDLISYEKFPPIGNYSHKIAKRLLSRIREFGEECIYFILAKLIYGRQSILLNPVAIAIWKRN